MCCSVSPNIEVKFSDTILYAAEVLNSQKKLVHVLGYQNRVQNNVNRFNAAGLWKKVKGLFTGSGGNAMLLPFPGRPGTMSGDNVLETENCSSILKDIAKTVTPPLFPTASFGPKSQSLSRAPVQIFEAAGIYTVVLAQDARSIPDALSRVPKEKRPQLNPELFEAYAEWYPDWTFALCCFNNEKAQDAWPMLWWYEPMNPERLFLPALDSHTGDIPDLNSVVQVNHTLAVGSHLNEAGDSGLNRKSLAKADDLQICRMCETENRLDNFFCVSCGSSLQIYGSTGPGNYKTVNYTDGEAISNEIKPYLVPQVIGEVCHKYLPNGDFVCRIEEVRKGIWNPVRTLPND